MTRRLILTRHAKSSWDDPAMADHDRPLNERGRSASADLGRWLASRGYLPGEVLCSDAVRTRATWDAVAAALDGAPGPQLKPALYNAASDTLLAVLRHAAAPTVMMIAHNPGIGEFARRILARAPSGPEFDHFPTGATLVAEFAADGWSGVGYGSGACLDFIVPREVDA